MTIGGSGRDAIGQAQERQADQFAAWAGVRAEVARVERLAERRKRHQAHHPERRSV